MNANISKENGDEPKTNAEKSDKMIETKKVVVRGLPRGGVIVASGDGFGKKRFFASELEQAVRCGVALRNQPIRGVGRGISTYPHKFSNRERFNFPTHGAHRAQAFLEIPLLRSPRGIEFSHRAVISDNPERVIFRLVSEEEAIYVGTLTHVGAVQQGLSPGSFVRAYEW